MHLTPQRFLVFVMGLAIIIAGSFYAIKQSNNQTLPSPSSTPVTSGSEITVEGVLTCLPFKKSINPVPDICAYGLKASNNSYYALDNSLYPSSIGNLNIGEKVTIKGIFTASKDLTTSLDYDVKGVLLVNEIN